ncbi:MAG TPA: thioredoxin [Candidatus Woesebacteria bacterium]|nr:thioredoxin [Candidatus Woesebacteria bacterium]
MSAIHLDNNSFKTEVIDAKGVVLVDFFAPWCGPCQMSAPVIDQMAEEYAKKTSIFKVDIDQARELAIAHNVMSVPTFIVFKDGQEINRQTGFPGKEALKAMIDQALTD